MREKLLLLRKNALDAFIVFTVLTLILSGVTRIMVGDTLIGMAIIIGVLGVVICVWQVGADFRWFRKTCVYPTTGIHVADWGYYTEGEPICRLYRRNAPMQDKTFSLCFNVLLPPAGSRAAFEEIMSGLDAWMAAQPCSMRLLGRMSANSQMAEVELCVQKKDAAPQVLESLYDCFERTADKTFTSYARRYIRVAYPDRGHTFYAAFDGFDIGRAIIVAGDATAWIDRGDTRGGFTLSTTVGAPDSDAFKRMGADLAEACVLYVDDNPLEGIRQTELIALEDFEKLWQPGASQPAFSLLTSTSAEQAGA